MSPYANKRNNRMQLQVSLAHDVIPTSGHDMSYDKYPFTIPLYWLVDRSPCEMGSTNPISQ